MTRNNTTNQRRHFVFLNPCGCPLGLVEQRPGVRNEDAAWRNMFETRAAERQAAARGVRMVHVDHDTYLRDYAAKMRTSCPHGGSGGSR